MLFCSKMLALRYRSNSAHRVDVHSVCCGGTVQLLIETDGTIVSQAGVLAGQTGAHEVVSYWGGVEPSVLHTGFLVNQLTNNENRKNSIEFFIFSLQLQSPKTSSTQPNSTTNLRVQY